MFNLFTFTCNHLASENSCVRSFQKSDNVAKFESVIAVKSNSYIHKMYVRINHINFL